MSKSSKHKKKVTEVNKQRNIAAQKEQKKIAAEKDQKKMAEEKEQKEMGRVTKQKENEIEKEQKDGTIEKEQKTPDSKKEQKMARKDESLQMLNSEERKNMFLGIFLLISAILTVSLFAALSTLEDDDGDVDEEPSNLQIDDVQTMLLSNDTKEYNLDFVVYVTNTANGEAKNIRVEVAGVDYSSKLTYSIKNKTVETIPGEKTTELHIPITVPQTKSYKIRIMVFEDDIVKIKGSSIISIEASGTHKDFKVDYDKASTSYTIEENYDEDELSGFTVFIGIIFFLLLIVEVLVIVSRMDFAVFGSAIGKVGNNMRR